MSFIIYYVRLTLQHILLNNIWVNIKKHHSINFLKLVFLHALLKQINGHYVHNLIMYQIIKLIYLLAYTYTRNRIHIYSWYPSPCLIIHIGAMYVFTQFFFLVHWPKWNKIEKMPFTNFKCSQFSKCLIFLRYYYKHSLFSIMFLFK